MQAKQCLWVLPVILLSGCSSLPQMLQLKDPLSAQEHEMLAKAYENSGENKLAAKEYDAALRENPKSAPLLIAAGNFSFNQGDYKSALKRFKRAQKQVPTEAAVTNNLAMTYLALGKTTKARRWAQTAIEQGGPMTAYAWDTVAQVALVEKNCALTQEAVTLAEAAAPAEDPTFFPRLKQTKKKAETCLPTH